MILTVPKNEKPMVIVAVIRNGEVLLSNKMYK